MWLAVRNRAHLSVRWAQKLAHQLAEGLSCANAGTRCSSARLPGALLGLATSVAKGVLR
jgi:hypothetical protein